MHKLFDVDQQWVNQQLKPLLDIGKGQDHIDPLQYLAPRNLNADLRRDFKDKYRILEQRTKYAINRIVKAKIEAENNGDTRDQEMNGNDGS